MNTAKRKKFVERVNRQKLDNEPKLSADNYESSIGAALNYYNDQHDNKEKKKWALNYIATFDPAITADLERVDDFYFRSYGTLARLITREQVLSDAHMLRMGEMLNEIKSKIPKKVDQPKVVAAQVVSIQDRILEKAREVAGDIEGEIDDFIAAGCPKDYKLSTPIKSYGAPIVKYLSTAWVPLKKELEEAIEGDDAQLVEGYSNFKKVELKRFLAFIESIIQECQQRVVTAKAQRKPRARKAKPAGIVAGKVKYMNEFAEMGLKSEHPTKLVNADEVWIYNTKYRRLTVYKPADSGLLTVKGTTMINFDITTSISKTLRKPEVIKDFASMGKRALNTAFKQLTTKPSKPNGRINEECIILKAF
jgi:hypothetical protein